MTPPRALSLRALAALASDAWSQRQLDIVSPVHDRSTIAISERRPRSPPLPPFREIGAAPPGLFSDFPAAPHTAGVFSCAGRGAPRLGVVRPSHAIAPSSVVPIFRRMNPPPGLFIFRGVEPRALASPARSLCTGQRTKRR